MRHHAPLLVYRYEISVFTAGDQNRFESLTSDLPVACVRFLLKAAIRCCRDVLVRTKDRFLDKIVSIRPGPHRIDGRSRVEGCRNERTEVRGDIPLGQ